MDSSAGRASKPVWDIVVRTLHWFLVLAFFTAYASGDDESGLHVWAGYAVLAIVSARVIWGFVGTKHARFSDFIYAPGVTWRYARSLLSARPIHYVGHNPLGGWMIAAMLVTLAGTCWSGLEAEALEGRGLLAASAGVVVAAASADEDRGRRHENDERKRNNGDEFWGEAHEALANLALVLVVAHIAGVLIGSALHRENLIKAMVTGSKETRALDSPSSRR